MAFESDLGIPPVLPNRVIGFRIPFNDFGAARYLRVPVGKDKIVSVV